MPVKQHGITFYNYVSITELGATDYWRSLPSMPNTVPSGRQNLSIYKPIRREEGIFLRSADENPSDHLPLQMDIVTFAFKVLDGYARGENWSEEDLITEQ